MNRDKLATAIAGFRATYPDFKSFQEPGPTFSKEELAYKRNLAAECQELAQTADATATSYAPARTTELQCGSF